MVDSFFSVAVPTSFVPRSATTPFFYYAPYEAPPPPPPFEELVLLAGGTDDIRGGGQVVLRGDVLDTSACSTLIGWTSFGATVTPYGGLLFVDTAGTAGARSGTADEGSLDVEVTFEVVEASLPLYGRVVFGQLGLLAGTSSVRIGIEYKDGLTALFFDVQDQGAPTVDVRKYISAGVSKFSARVQRLGSRVIMTVAGQRLEAVWTPALAEIEVAVTNAAVWAGPLTRRPLIAFGDQISTSILSQTGNRLVAVVPPTVMPSIVSISAHGCGISETLPNAFEYTIAGRYQVRSKAALGHILNDDTLRNTDAD